MLKPKKNITKKDIRRDPFLEKVDQAQAHIEKNRAGYVRGAVVAIVLVIGYNLMSGKRTENELMASAALGEALVSLDKNDITTAVFQFENLIDEYHGTNSSAITNYYLGKIKYDQGELKVSRNYLEEFLNENPISHLKDPTYIMLADIERLNGDVNQAIEILNNGIKNCEDTHSLRGLKLQKAKLLLIRGDISESKFIVDGILEQENLNSNHRIIAEELSGKLVS